MSLFRVMKLHMCVYLCVSEPVRVGVSEVKRIKVRSTICSVNLRKS